MTYISYPYHCDPSDPRQASISEAKDESNIDGDGDIGAGYDYAVFAVELEKRGWKFCPDPANGGTIMNRNPRLPWHTRKDALADFWASLKAEPYSTLREYTLCRLDIHSRPSRRIHKFNGGNGAWLCCYCHLIVCYGHENK